MRASSPQLVRAWAVVLVVVCIGAGASALRMQMEAGSRKCLGEDLNKDVLVMGAFKVISASSGAAPGFEVKVTSPSGSTLFSKVDAAKGKFALTAASDGLHQLCFVNPGPQPRNVEFSFKHGVDAKDYSNVAKKDHLEPLEVELRRLEDAVAEVYEEMLYMRTREEEMRNTNESTNSRVMWYSVFTIVVLMGLGAAQVWILRRDFKAKRLIY